MSVPHFDSALSQLRKRQAVPGWSGTWREAAVRRGLLPVYEDWMCCYALTPDADVVYTADAGWADHTRLTNARHRFIVLAQTAKQYPELAYLRPVRGPRIAVGCWNVAPAMVAIVSAA